MKKYPSYKDSGVEWIGDIPSHWETTQLRRLGDLFGGLTGKSGDDFRSENHPNNKPYIPYTNIFNNTYISKNHFHQVVINEGENQNRVQKFDMFFLMSSETYEDLGKPCILIEDVEELYLNSFCKGFRINNGKIYPLFLNYELLSDTHKKLISIEGQGFTRINLRQDRLKETPILLPPLSEQHKIVSYLDEKTSQIDTLIQTKKRKIGLLKEYRTSLINEVVTKGLNPDVEMKDSGVEWIGEIPRSWSITRVKFISNIKRGSSPRPIDNPDYFDDEGEYSWVRISDVSKCGKYLTETTQKMSDMGKNLSLPLISDTLCMSISGSVGKVFLTKIKCCIHDGFVSFQDLKIDVEFFYNILTNEQLYHEDRKLGTQFNINSGIVGNKEIPLPPLSEQQEIVSYLDEQTGKVDEEIGLEERKIELLKDYRTSLISDVVTGKINVQDEVIV